MQYLFIYPYEIPLQKLIKFELCHFEGHLVAWPLFCDFIPSNELLWISKAALWHWFFFFSVLKFPFLYGPKMPSCSAPDCNNRSKRCKEFKEVLVTFHNLRVRKLELIYTATKDSLRLLRKLLNMHVYS